MEYTIYCDESRHTGAAGDRYMAIGGLWVPKDLKSSLTREFRDLKRLVGLNSEVKWSKVSSARLHAYQSLIDFFLSKNLNFRVIVVDQAKVDCDRFHGGDRELGFYKFYYEMLIKWLLEGNQYVILLDFKQNEGARRYTALRTVLERILRGVAWISDLTVIDSIQTPLAQLCDLLTGAVAASWCDGLAQAGPKRALAQHLAAGLNKGSLKFESPAPAFESSMFSGSDWNSSMLQPADLNRLLEDVSGLSGSALFEKGLSLYRELYLTKEKVGEDWTHDAHMVIFHLARFEHAFQTTSDGWIALERKDVVDSKRIARIRWIRPVLRGQAAGTCCFEVPAPTGRSRPPNRLYVLESELYVVWLEPRNAGGWKFSSAYPATREAIAKYKTGEKTVGRW